MYRMFGLAEKLNIQNCENSTVNCIHCMCGISGFAENLNIQNCINLMGNCVHSMYGMSGFAENWISRTAKIQREIVYIIYVWTSGFAKKLNV